MPAGYLCFSDMQTINRSIETVFLSGGRAALLLSAMGLWFSAGCWEQGLLPGYTRILAPTSERLVRTYKDLQSKRFQVLADFETPQQQSLFQLVSPKGSRPAKITTERARRDTGVGSLKMSLFSSKQQIEARDVPESQWAFYRDWSKYHLLLFSVYSPRKLGGFTMSVHSGTDVSLTYKHSRIPLEQGWNLIRIDLADLSDQIDLSDVREVHFWCEVLDTPIDLYLDDLILADNTREVFSSPDKQEGDLYVLTRGRRLIVGTVDRFELVFSQGRIHQWFDLSTDPARIHNLVGAGILGPVPVIVPKEVKAKILLDDATQWSGLGLIAESYQSLLEASPLRVMIQGEWRFGSPDIPPDDSSPYHRWVYSIYKDGRVYLECSGTAGNEDFKPEGLGMVFCCDGSQNFKRQLREGGASGDNESAKAKSYILFSRNDTGKSDLLIVPFGPTAIRVLENPQDPRLCVMCNVPVVSDKFAFSAMIRIRPTDMDTPEKADPFADDYYPAPPIKIDTGRCVRTDAGDFDNDGFSESRGYHVIQLDGSFAKIHIDGSRHTRYSPVFKLVDVADRDVWVYLDGRLIKEIYRDQDGNALFELPTTISGPALLEITSLARKKTAP